MNQDELNEKEETTNLNKETPSAENGEEHYSLYTEHIVDNPWEKVKRYVKRGLVLLAMAVVFGLIAGLVMIIVNHMGNHLFGPQEPQTTPTTTEEATTAQTPTTTEPSSDATEEESRNDLSISVDEGTSDEQTEEQTEEPTESTEVDEAVLNLEANYEVLKKISHKVNQYMVTVTISKETVDWFASTYQNVTKECGFVIANNEAGCYIVTDYDLVKNAAEVSVTFASGVEKPATILSGDATTGLVVLLTETVEETDTAVATLSSAEGVAQGDLVLAVGKIYGFPGSMGYGIATSVSNHMSDTDTSYQLVNTNISGLENSAGVITNVRGEVVAIITNNYAVTGNNLVTGYSINGIQRLVQNLSNSHETAYLGIRGQNVTEEIKEKYELLDGVYIAAVETNSPAYKAGLQSGDILVGLDGKDVLTMDKFMEVMSEHVPGDAIMLSIQRKGREKYKLIEFQAVLGVE